MSRARAGRGRRVVLDELIRGAKETGAGIHFIDDASLLAAAGGVGATPRYST